MTAAEAIFRQFERKIEALRHQDENGESGFSKEFQSLRQTSFKYKGNSNYSTVAGESPTNRVKNRFKDILPFDYTRVTLPSNGQEGSDYINANFIKGVHGEKVYIASQGPLPNTVNDFWRMLWTYKVKVVVMLCRENESGKKKCQRYWCKDDEEQLEFGGIRVKTGKCINVGNNFVMRTLVAELEGEKQILTQFHYTAWPDHGVPPTALPLMDLIKLVREYQPEDKPPIVLHCSAGCGRTGTICALDYAQTLLKEMKFEHFDPYRIVENLRKQRPAMVQTKGQYEFMCHAMCSLFREKLKLPYEEEHDDHLYVNVSSTTLSNDDDDSDNAFTPSSPIVPDKPFSHVSARKGISSALLPTKESENKRNVATPRGRTSAILNQPRLGHVSQPHENDNRENVAFDLIDLSDGPTPNSTQDKKSSRAKVANAARANEMLKLPERQDVVDGGRVGLKKVPVSRQASAPDYINFDKSRSMSDYETMDRGAAPGKEGQVSLSKSSRSLPNQTYENVPQARPSRPHGGKRPPVPWKSSALGKAIYDNVDVNNFASPNPGRNLQSSRSQSSSKVEASPPDARPEQKFITYGPKMGAQFAEQIRAMNGLQRAKVLPNDDYAVVNSRELSGRNHGNENVVKDGRKPEERAEVSSKKSVEHLNTAEEQDSSHVSKNKGLSLTNKIPFLSKRPEMQTMALEYIGYGKRVPKPKGPRSPPKNWVVKS